MEAFSSGNLIATSPVSKNVIRQSYEGRQRGKPAKKHFL